MASARRAKMRYLEFSMKYQIGDTISYRPFGGGIRHVIVNCKEDDIKKGEPGFIGELVWTDIDKYGRGRVWGYDYQITAINPPTRN